MPLLSCFTEGLQGLVFGTRFAYSTLFHLDSIKTLRETRDGLPPPVLPAT